MSDYRRPYTFDRVVRILFSICGLLATLYLLDILKGVLLPFLVACLISYMLEPFVKWNRKLLHTQKRFLPVMLTLLEACILVGIFCALFIPYLVEECAEMATMIKTYATKQIDIPLYFYRNTSVYQTKYRLQHDIQAAVAQRMGRDHKVKHRLLLEFSKFKLFVCCRCGKLADCHSLCTIHNA